MRASVYGFCVVVRCLSFIGRLADLSDLSELDLSESSWQAARHLRGGLASHGPPSPVSLDLVGGVLSS